MPFSPYHRFQNKTRLEKVVSDFKSNGNIQQEVHSNFHRYHPALIHKLRSAKYNIERLKEKLTTTDLQEAADTTGEFMFQVNMYIDGFFYNAGSSLDILARVILVLFNEPLTGNIYFQTAHQRLNTNRPTDQILSRIAPPAWRSNFSDYRNTLTHELVLAPRYQIDIDNTGETPTYKIIFPLPDDPRAIPSERTFRNNPDVLDYVTINFTRILRILNTVYGDIADRANATGVLPL